MPRLSASRRCLRYPSDLTDAEWALVAPMIPPAKRSGRPRQTLPRKIIEALGPQQRHEVFVS